MQKQKQIILKIIRALEELPSSSHFQDPPHCPPIPRISLTFPIPVCAPLCAKPPQLWKFAGALFPPLFYLAIPKDRVTSPSKPLLKHLSSILCLATTSLHVLSGALYSVSLSTTPGHSPFPYTLHRFLLPSLFFYVKNPDSRLLHARRQ